MLLLDWIPDKTSSVPLYIQIKEYIRTNIENGRWTVGMKIPTQRYLAEKYGVNRSTVVTAIEELIGEGLLEGKSGSGTRVANNSWSLLSALRPPNWSVYVDNGIHYPNLSTIQKINQLEFQPHIQRLGTGEMSPSLFPSAMMKQILQTVSQQVTSLGYEEPKGSLGLRKEISRYLATKGLNVDPSSVLIVSGALQAIQLIAIGILKKGSTILHERPSYLYSLHVFQSAGMNLQGIPMDSEGLDVKMMIGERRKTNAAILYTIPSFHNPTGLTMSQKRRTDILNTCERESLPIIEDDVYGDLWFDSPAPLPLKSHDRTGQVLYLGSLSKTLSPGLRIGWLIGPETVIDRLADIKMQTDYGSSSISQRAAEEWLASGMYTIHLERIRDELKRRRDIALNALEKFFSGIARWNTPTGGYYIWLELTHSISPTVLFEQCLHHGLLINPGSIYGSYETTTIRLSYSYVEPLDLQQGIMNLSHIVKELIKQ
nr:PLP-dependent aminotransferase family protein [Ammoniphilus sp. CFH 90114]